MKQSVVLLAVLGLLPCPLGALDFSALGDWKAVSDSGEYGPENLWEYIDGAAEQFLGYGFLRLSHCDLKHGDLTVTVSVYDMGSALNAFGVYGAERGDEENRLAIGTEAVLFAPYQGLLVKGAFYVKVDASKGELTQEEGLGLLNILASALPGDDAYPRELQRLPSEGRIRGSERYVRRGFLGLSELPSCLHASYGGGDEPSWMFFTVIPLPDRPADAVWRDISAKWKPVKNASPPILFREVPYKGFVGVKHTNAGIVGVAGVETLDILLDRLRRAAP